MLDAVLLSSAETASMQTTYGEDAALPSAEILYVKDNATIPAKLSASLWVLSYKCPL